MSLQQLSLLLVPDYYFEEQLKKCSSNVQYSVACMNRYASAIIETRLFIKKI